MKGNESKLTQSNDFEKNVYVQRNSAELSVFSNGQCFASTIAVDNVVENVDTE